MIAYERQWEYNIFDVCVRAMMTEQVIRDRTKSSSGICTFEYYISI